MLTLFKRFFSFTLILLSSCVFAQEAALVNKLPSDFVYLNEIDPSIIQAIKYSTEDNFVGRPIRGYYGRRCILTRSSALALAKVQKELLSKNLSLKVFDCYRPTTAVLDFLKWSKDSHDQKQKLTYYPEVNKADFFKLGYVAEKSGHSRGSTIDLTVINLQGNSSKDLDMGTHFDFMDETSHFANHTISKKAQANRLYLRNLLKKYGFKPCAEEWWHFTLAKEPFPTTYFNFPVE